MAKMTLVLSVLFVIIGARCCLFNEIDAIRAANARVALRRADIAQQYADLRALQFGQYMATRSPATPGFNPHEGHEATAGAIGFNLWSENLAYISQSPAYIVGVAWNDPAHMATLLAADATVYGVSCVFLGGTPYWAYGAGYNDRVGRIIPTAAPTSASLATPMPVATAPVATTTAMTSTSATEVATTTTTTTTTKATTTTSVTVPVALNPLCDAQVCATCSDCFVAFLFTVTRFPSEGDDAALTSALLAALPGGSQISFLRSTRRMIVTTREPMATLSLTTVSARRTVVAATLVKLGWLVELDDDGTPTRAPIDTAALTPASTAAVHVLWLSSAGMIAAIATL